MDKDFTLAKYDALCAALVDVGFISMSMGDYLSVPPASDQRIIMLRHDVDSRPAHALQMGAIEQKHGLTATYFFRTVPAAFDAEAVRQMSALGHEVGYHYETLSQANGNMEKALSLFPTELDKLRQLAPVKIASMHGSPLRPWDNRAIWQHAKPEDFGLVGEVYRDIDYQRVTYLSDTGRSWNPTRYNVRDVTGVIPPFRAESTDDLITLLPDPRLKHLCLLTHPERWQDDPLAWNIQTARDVATNLAKVLIKQVYALRGGR